MSLSNFPFGVTSFGIPLIAGDTTITTGTAFFVHSSTGSDSYDGKTPATPFATIDAAINACTAGKGDKIFVLPGHAENVANATTINLDVSGITIQGLGTGLLRPTITFTTATTATLPVSAANITLRNLVFSANFADIVSVFTIAAADDFRVEGCLFKATATNMNFLHIFDTGTTDASCDGLTFIGNEWFEPDAATLAFGLVDCAIDRMNISDNLIVTGNATQDTAALLTCATGKNLTNLRIMRNNIDVTGHASSTAGVLITTDATAGTGIIAYNNVKHLDATTEILITATHTWGLFENRMTAVANAQGYLLPAVDS